MKNIGNEIFDNLAKNLKRLALETKLDKLESQELAAITEKLNELRSNYTDRRLEEIRTCLQDMAHQAILKEIQ